jgi:subtilisin family serine protease
MGSQVIPTGIRRAQANLNTKAGINGSDERVNADIAIIDTGIDLSHPDLNVYKNVNLIDASKTGADDNGHGTHVAGIAAALDSQVGVVGMAPGSRLWAVKVLGKDGSGYMSDIIKGIEYVTEHADEIEVANMSLGCECQSQALDTAIANATGKGVVFTVAAGNSGKNASTFAPANNPSVLTVSAIADYDGKAGGLTASGCRSDKDDTFASFSNYGSAVDIAAPGVCITSTGMGGKYVQMSGTSMASPHVAGAVALYLSSRTKPKTSSDVASVRSAIAAAGFTGNSLFGYTGDKDGTYEPLLNAKSL